MPQQRRPRQIGKRKRKREIEEAFSRISAFVDGPRKPEGAGDIPVLTQEITLPLEPTWQREVIRIENCDELTASSRDGLVHRNGNAAVLVECLQLDPRIDEAANDVGRAVGRSIV